jgi:phosphoglycerol transferase MdoB-like AlkP superfamily enzyme
MAIAARVTVSQTLPRGIQYFLSIWLFSAFLTQLKVVPGLRNNLGLFEIFGLISLLLLPAFKFTSLETKHPVIKTLGLITLVAVISQLQIPFFL